jgi:phage terminase large subunit GpA-like protein
MTLAALLVAHPERCALRIFAQAALPPPPIDLNAWAIEHLEFPPGSPYPGPYDPDLLPFFRRPLEVLGPDHPARHVTLLKSAQLGGTLLAQIFVAASMDLDPGGIIHVHPTEPNATGYARTKWRPMVRSCRRLMSILEGRQSKEGGNSTLHQERRDGLGWLRISGANSPASLSMYSAKRLVKDDLSKWENNEAGDPEAQAESRTKAFRDAKIFAIGTGLLKGKCRTTVAFKAGTQEHWHVPCPHCGYKHPLEPENFVANIDPDHPKSVWFTCPSCGGVIEEKHRADIVARGEWVAHNRGAPDVSFYVWAAYAPFEPWERIARAYLAARGDPKSEQVWWNDTAGRAYELPGEAPAWEELKKRAEAGQRLRGVVPIGALLLTLTLDCQDEWIDGVVIGWGRDLRRWYVDQVRIEGHISTPEARAELNVLVDKAWPTAAGSRRRVDLTGIDANAWTDDVFDWAKNFSKSRVVMVRGTGGDAAPSLALVRKERRRDGKIVKYQGRFFNVGVSGLKGGLYKFLRVTDPDQRGYVDIPAGLEDDFYEQLTAEKRTAVIDRKGFTAYQWIKPRSQRNEMLDVSVYGEALAGKLGWRTNTPAMWAALEAEREIAAERSAQPQLGLFTDTGAKSSPSLPIGSEPAASAVSTMAPARRGSILRSLMADAPETDRSPTNGSAPATAARPRRGLSGFRNL